MRFISVLALLLPGCWLLPSTTDQAEGTTILEATEKIRVEVNGALDAFNAMNERTQATTQEEQEIKRQVSEQISSSRRTVSVILQDIEDIITRNMTINYKLLFDLLRKDKK